MADLVTRLRYRGRNLRYRRLFDVLRHHARGDVLDVGGGSFAATATRHGVRFDTWTVVEPSMERLPERVEGRVRAVVGDGCALGLASESFDTVLSVQVLEHVFEPIRMFADLHRVLRVGGSLIVMVPQTANLHHVPDHFQNFTRFWLDEAASRLGMTVVEYHALGGAWSTVASRLVLQYPAMFGARGYRLPGARRSRPFWVLAPIGMVISAAGVAASLLMSLGDLEEEANNHLMVLRKDRAM